MSYLQVLCATFGCVSLPQDQDQGLYKDILLKSREGK